MSETLVQRVVLELLGSGTLPTVAAESATELNRVADAQKRLTAEQERASWKVTNADEKTSKLRFGSQEDASSFAAEYQRNRTAQAANRFALGSAVSYAAGYGTIVGMGGQANPQSVERLNRAFADLSGAIGRDLLPYLETATSVVRSLADAYVSLPGVVKSGTAFVIAFGTSIAAVAATSILATKTINFMYGTISAGASVFGRLTGAITSTAVAANVAAASMEAAAARTTAAAVAGGAGSAAGVAAGGVAAGASRGILGRAVGAVAAGARFLGPVGLAVGTGLAIGGGYLLSRGETGESYGQASRPASQMSAEGFLSALQQDASMSGAKVTLNDVNKSLQDILGVLKSDSKAPVKIRNFD